MLKTKNARVLCNVAGSAFTAIVFAVVLGLAHTRTVQAAEPLKVFILAGQSNMQGHAEVSTLAYLPKAPYVPTEAEIDSLTTWVVREMGSKVNTAIKAELAKDPANEKLSKKDLGALQEKMYNAEMEKLRTTLRDDFVKRQTDAARVARDKELAAIFAADITDQKVLDTLASAKNIRGALEVATEWQTKLNLPVGKHTYIAAYGGVNRGTEGTATGPLSTGYGARPTAFGPEYAFGMMLEKQLNQPILIIKTSWGGKSLHYDFRPPSAGPYQPTANEKNGLENWKARKAAWDKYIAGGGTPEAMAKIEKEIQSVEKQKQALQAAIAKLPKEQLGPEREKLTALNAKTKELHATRVPLPGNMPTHDAAGAYWNDMIGFVRKVLADPKAYHPEYDPKAGFEVAGALWFQGFNDQFDPEYYGNYSSNMVHFIQDLRKEVKQPKMPFVIGVLGTNAFRETALTNNVSQGQRQAASNPELAGTVTAVESWPLTTPEVSLWRFKLDAARAKGNADEVKQAEQQWPLYGSNLGYHYDGSGRFFIRLGDECANAILKLMGRK